MCTTPSLSEVTNCGHTRHHQPLSNSFFLYVLLDTHTHTLYSFNIFVKCPLPYKMDLRLAQKNYLWLEMYTQTSGTVPDSCTEQRKGRPTRWQVTRQGRWGARHESILNTKCIQNRRDKWKDQLGVYWVCGENPGGWNSVRKGFSLQTVLYLEEWLEWASFRTRQKREHAIRGYSRNTPTSSQTSQESKST